MEKLLLIGCTGFLSKAVRPMLDKIYEVTDRVVLEAQYSIEASLFVTPC